MNTSEKKKVRMQFCVLRSVFLEPFSVKTVKYNMVNPQAETQAHWQIETV